MNFANLAKAEWVDSIRRESHYRGDVLLNTGQTVSAQAEFTGRFEQPMFSQRQPPNESSLAHFVSRCYRDNGDGKLVLSL